MVICHCHGEEDEQIQNYFSKKNIKKEGGSCRPWLFSVMSTGLLYFTQPRFMPMKTKMMMATSANPTLIVPMFILRPLLPVMENKAYHTGHETQGHGKPAFRRDNRAYQQASTHG